MKIRCSVFRFFLFVLIAFFAFSVTSCSKKDDKQQKSKKEQAHSKALGEEAAVKNPKAFMRDVEGGIVCPIHRTTLSIDKKYFANCEYRRTIIDTVDHMIKDGWSEQQIRGAVSLMQQGQHIAQDIQGAADCSGKNGRVRGDFFLMSHCPYGLMFVNNILPYIVQEHGETMDWAPHYIVGFKDGKASSLHGDAELNEDRYQVCLFKKHGGEEWLKYVRCYASFLENESKKQQAAPKRNIDWNAKYVQAHSFCANNPALDAKALSVCVKSEADALLKADAELGTKLNAQASPTSIFNCTKSVSGAIDYSLLKPNLCSWYDEGASPQACTQF